MVVPTFWVHPRHLRPRFSDSVNGNVNIVTSFFPTKLCIFFIEVSIVIPQIPGSVMAVQEDVQTCTILTLTSWARHITEKFYTKIFFFRYILSLHSELISFIFNILCLLSRPICPPIICIILLLHVFASRSFELVQASRNMLPIETTIQFMW